MSSSVSFPSGWGPKEEDRQATSSEETSLAGNAEPPRDRPPDESFFLLAAKLRQGLPRGRGVLSVTSLSRDEGAGAAAAGLARALAISSGGEVLAVDADLRAPSLHHRLSTKERAGLSDVLRDGAALSDALHPTGTPGLYLMPAGSAGEGGWSASSSASHARLLDLLRSRFPIAVQAAPPLGESGASRLVSARADGVLILVAENRHRRAELRRTIEELEAMGGRVVGTCLTKPGAVRPPGLIRRLREFASRPSRR